MRRSRSVPGKHPTATRQVPVRYWMVLGTMCAAASAGQAPPAPPPRGTPPPAAPAAPDEGLIEFLGAEDVADTAWWEYLKRAAARKATPPAPPPQDAKQ